jgi:rod shape-determining protein MreD
MSAGRVVETRGSSGGSLEAKLALRLAIVAFAAVVLQLSFFAELRLFGGHADILPLVALACGLLTGSIPGAFTGFAIGIMSDALMDVPLGLTSLVLVLIGGLGGLIAERRDPEGYLIPAFVGAVVTFGALIFFAIVQLLLGAPVGASWGLLQQIITTSLLNGLIAPFVYAIVRLVLVGALSRDPRRRRRRATTTRLSPLSSSRGQRNRRSRAASARGATRRGGTLGGSSTRRRR